MIYLLDKSEYIILAITLVIIITIVFLYNKIYYKTEIEKQDLALKCQEIYNAKHVDVENIRFNSQSADAIIWSPKTKTCLAYYNVRQPDYSAYQFEVWDYTNTDLVLSYKSSPSKDCVYEGHGGVIFNQDSLIYKLNPKLQASGCYIDLSRRNIDVLTNFEKAMLDLGFKK